jgi:predicted PurR-regulated permease PerM
VQAGAGAEAFGQKIHALENLMIRPVTLSNLLAIVATCAVLYFHLVPAVFAGLAVYVLTLKLARHLPRNMNRFAHKVALGVVVVCVISCLTSVGALVWSYMSSSQAIAALLTTVVDTLESLRKTLPVQIAEALPATIEDLRQQLVSLLGLHAQKLSIVGLEGIKFLAHIILGMVIGGMAALHHFNEHEKAPPFISSMRTRLGNLATAFDKVVFAQVKISGLNAALTAVYLLVALPLFGVKLPMATILVLLTFAVGMLPVVGNLISNSVIVVISLGISLGVGIASLLFLVLIHKAEYFMNARIVGHEVQATAWELLSAMLLFEAIFGIAGLVAAPVVYAWLKAEVKAQGMI